MKFKIELLSLGGLHDSNPLNSRVMITHPNGKQEELRLYISDTVEVELAQVREQQKSNV